VVKKKTLKREIKWVKPHFFEPKGDQKNWKFKTGRLTQEGERQNSGRNLKNLNKKKTQAVVKNLKKHTLTN